jgi:hypothetical protein
MWPFKKEKIKEKKPKCKHYKKFGEEMPDNMVKIIKFTDGKSLKDEVFSYGIWECTVCGKRAFSCVGCHLMPVWVTSSLDKFIEHKISMSDLIKVFNEWSYDYEEIKIDGTL